MVRIEWTRLAIKSLKRIDKNSTKRVEAAIFALTECWPDCRNIKSLSGRDGYRLRIGDYRAIFTATASGEIIILKIEKVSKRDERTYQ